MTAQDIIAKVKQLQWPPDSYMVFGICPLALAGLREAQDIDLFVTPELYAQLHQAGWQQIDKGEGHTPLVRDEFDVHENWNFGSYRPTFEDLRATATIEDGVPFVSLAEVRKWKLAFGRPKDIADVALIDAHQAH